jgi:beclin 1
MNLISSRTDVDHPLCAECTHSLLASLGRQLDETKKERDGYIAFEKEVRKEKEREKDGLTPQEAEKKIAKLAQEEKLVIAQLKDAEKEREQLETELKALGLEEKALEEEEAEFVTLSPLLVCSSNRRADFGERITHNSFEPLNRHPSWLRSGQRTLLIPPP